MCWSTKNGKIAQFIIVTFRKKDDIFVPEGSDKPFVVLRELNQFSQFNYRIKTQEQLDELRRVAPDMLEEWSQTKKAPKHAAWLHELEFRGTE